MNEKKDKKKMVMTVVVAGLLLMSVLTAATAVVSAEESQGDSPTVDDEKSAPEMENTPSMEEVQKRMKQLQKEFDKNGIQRKPQVVSEEKQQKIKGETNPTRDEKVRTDPHTKDLHNVDPVHSMGIEGQDVTVSLMDTGFDMAHPDLAGRHAVFEYDAATMEPEMEQFDGYPIAYDAVSMAEYVVSGDASEANWYVDTSYEATAYDDNGTIFAIHGDKPVGDHIYEMPDAISEGDKVRFGLHPDEKLNQHYGERPAVLLTKDGGEWSNVYTDLDNDRNFSDEDPAYIDGTEPTSELMTKDVTGDGITDISGGMAYFIAEENATGENMPIPYTQNEQFRETMNTMINLALGYPPGTLEMITGDDAWSLLELDYHNTPDPGEMVALMGDFNGPTSYGTHGTRTASAVAGQGMTGYPGAYPPGSGDGLIQGLAPESDIIPMGDFFTSPGNALSLYDVPYSSIFFASEGYDGNTSTNADQAQIASSSFGKTSGYATFGGYDYYERLFDYVGTYHTQSTLFVNSAGNEGTAFGTLGSPSGGEAVLSAGGASNQYYRTDPWYESDEGPNPWQGEVAHVGSRGPAGRGTQGVDVLANAEFGYGSIPVNQMAFDFGQFYGAYSWELWSGTSLAAPNTAGVAALAYQAYWEAHGTRPTAMQVKDFIKQGAQDINNSPYNQGSGLLDAEGAVEIAQEEGLLSSTSEWRPGTNPTTGTSTDMHVNMMNPGDTEKESFSLENRNQTDPVDYSVEATQLQEDGVNELTMSSGVETHPALMINETGIYDLVPVTDDEGNITNWSAEFREALEAPNADLFRFETHAAEAGGISLLETHHWTDVDGDENYNGTDERNRIGYQWAAYNDQTNDYSSIYNPIDRVEDGIIVRLRNFGLPSFEFDLTIRQYNEVTWDWISVDNATGTVPADDTVEYNLTADVPGDAGQGVYGGKVMIENVDTGRVNVVPVTITVGDSLAVTNGRFDMEFGANDGNQDYEKGIYRNDRLYGAHSGGATGSWRRFHFNLEAGTNSPVAMNLNLNGSMDVEAYLLGPAEEPDAFSGMVGSRYGMYNLEVMQTTDTVKDNMGFVTDGPLDKGVYAVAVHSLGMAEDEAFEGQLFTVGEKDNEYDEEYTITSQTEADEYTSGTLKYVTTAGFDADPVEPVSAPPSVTETETWVDTTGPGNAGWGKAYFVKKATQKEVTMQDVSSFAAEIVAAEAPDLDMGLLRDANGNGEPDMDDTLVATSGTMGSMESIVLDNPQDGIYWVCINPYEGTAGDEFTAEISKTIEVPGISWEIDAPDSFTAGDVVTFQINYTLPASQGTYGTWIGIGRENFSRGLVLEPTITLNDGVPGSMGLAEGTPTTISEPGHTLVYEYSDPVFYSGFLPAETTVYFDGKPIPDEAYTSSAINGEVYVDAYKANSMMGFDGTTHEMTVETVDEAGNEITSEPTNLYIDTLRMGIEELPTWTNEETLNIRNSWVMPGSTVEVNGEEVYVRDNGDIWANIDLDEGTNQLIFNATDGYGNSIKEIRNVIYDANAPTIDLLDYPESTGRSSATIKVDVSDDHAEKADLEVMVNGAEADLGSDQLYKRKVSLTDGANDVTVKVADKAGNMAEEQFTITYDSPYLTDADLNEIRTRLDEMENDITELYDEIDRLDTEIGELDGRITDLEARLDDFQTDLDVLEVRIRNLENDVGSLQEDVNTLQAELDDIDIQELQNQIDELRSDLDDLDTEKADQQDLQNLQKRVNTLENDIDDIDQLQTDVDNLQNRVEDLETDSTGEEEQDKASQDDFDTLEQMLYGGMIGLLILMIILVAGVYMALKGKMQQGGTGEPEETEEEIFEETEEEEEEPEGDLFEETEEEEEEPGEDLFEETEEEEEEPEFFEEEEE